MNHFIYKVLVQESAEGETRTREVGEVELTGAEYEADLGAAALDAALAELRVNEAARLLLWRGYAFARETFRGLEVQLVSKWADA